MSEWYVVIDGQRQGPISTDSVLAYLKTRNCAEVQVWRKGFENWRLAKDVPELSAPAAAPMQGAVGTKANAFAASTPNTQTVTASPSGLTGFFKRLAQYYAEFLSTDFKKQRLPRRRLQNADAQGRLVGIPLRKYHGFQQKMWAELAKPVGTGISLSVSRGSWRSTLPRAVVEAIATHIAMVRQEDLDAVVATAMGKVAKTAERKSGDPDIAFEQFVEVVRSTLAKSVIMPLLDRMEGFFERTEHKPVESLRDLEDQLSMRLISGVERSSGAAFSKLLVEHEPGPLEAVLRDQLNETVVRGELEGFFETFSAGDLYVELSDLVRSSRLIDNVDFYLHIGEVKHTGHVFPIFYVPFTAEQD